MSQTTKRYYLGIDAGGTKTHILIVDDNNTVIAESKVGPAAHKVVDVQTAMDTISRGILATKLAALEKIKTENIPICASCIGLAGMDTKQEKQILSKEIIHLFTNLRLNPPLLVNDTQIALHSGTQNQNAIVLICGTGSNCYGRNDKDEEAWVDGLGHILTDEASSYMMGVKALRCAVKSMDGRGKKTILEELIGKHLSIKSLRDAKNIVYKNDFTKKDFGALSYLVVEACKHGDDSAQQILDDVINEALLMVQTVARRLNLISVFDLVLIGGLFQEPLFTDQLINKIHTSLPHAHLIFPDKPPVWGAILLAKTI